MSYASSDSRAVIGALDWRSISALLFLRRNGRRLETRIVFAQ
jgi:hypothetical protein